MPRTLRSEGSGAKVNSYQTDSEREDIFELKAESTTCKIGKKFNILPLKILDLKDGKYPSFFSNF